MIMMMQYSFKLIYVTPVKEILLYIWILIIKVCKINVFILHAEGHYYIIWRCFWYHFNFETDKKKEMIKVGYPILVSSYKTLKKQI